MSDKCKIHQTRELDFYCVDPHCKEDAIGCVICIKNNHKNCNDDLIVLKEEAKDKIKILDNETDPRLITTKLNQILELKLYEM